MLSHQNSKTATACAHTHTHTHTHSYPHCNPNKSLPSKSPNAVRQPLPLRQLTPNAKSSQWCCSFPWQRPESIISSARREWGRILHACTYTHAKVPSPLPPLRSIQSLAPCYVKLSGSYSGDVTSLLVRDGEKGRSRNF